MLYVYILVQCYRIAGLTAFYQKIMYINYYDDVE